MFENIMYYILKVKRRLSGTDVNLIYWGTMTTRSQYSKYMVANIKKQDGGSNHLYYSTQRTIMTGNQWKCLFYSQCSGHPFTQQRLLPLLTHLSHGYQWSTLTIHSHGKPVVKCAPIINAPFTWLLENIIGWCRAMLSPCYADTTLIHYPNRFYNHMTAV